MTKQLFILFLSVFFKQNIKTDFNNTNLFLNFDKNAILSNLRIKQNL